MDIKGQGMARMHVPAVAVGLLLFIGAALAGLLVFFIAGGATVGLMWAVCVFLGVLLAAVVVAVVRGHNASVSEQP